MSDVIKSAEGAHSYAGTASSFSYSGPNTPRDYDTALFQQAGFTVAKPPAAGLGALLEVVATPYDSIYVDNDASDRH